MMLADWGNALFELGGGILIWLNVRKLYHDKMVRGVHWGPIGFFAGWGYWNIYYYWAMNSPLSWWAGIAVVAANSVWWAQILYYSWRERSGYRWQSSYIDGTDTVLAHWTKEQHIFDREIREHRNVGPLCEEKGKPTVQVVDYTRDYGIGINAPNRNEDDMGNVFEGYSVHQGTWVRYKGNEMG